jgi:PAS domain S-box-containing protein
MGIDLLGCDCFRFIIEASPAAVIMIGGAGDVRYANAEVERMFGYRREELLGRSIDILVPARLRRRHACHRRGFMANPSKRLMGPVGGSERVLKGRRRDGSEFPIQIGLAPLETRSGLLVAATLVDVTERRETEKALAQSVQELERSNERLLRFAYVASLDLQKPLLEIAEQSRRLEQAVASADRANMIEASRTMRNRALGARKLVDDLLIYARTIYGEQQLEALDLREEVRFSLAGLSQLIAASNAQLRVDVPAVTFVADRGQFARLMQNVIANAIKYHKPGCCAKIDVTATLRDDSTLRLAIADQGVGFDEEFARRIFEPFSAPSDDTEYAGTGIELAVCKSIADRHGWSISVKSHPGKGATFFFTIPTPFAIPTSSQE